MAEIDSSQGGGKKGGKVRSKKASTKVDMTPMVDLAFLLITFFMLATTLSKPQAMQLNMPDKNNKQDPPKLKESESMTLIIGEKNKLYYYTSIEKPELFVTNYGAKGARALFNEGNKLHPGKFTIVVKPMPKSSYKNMVDMVDELNLTESRFAILDITPQEMQLVWQKEGLIPQNP
ncbi:MAG: biopolymer transporter ExbD [Cytophagaceae bacterium]|jgi:biopolymer transport protein ExbD|nr:biopolymer transporter ExbD [Cytophagaceae bacterium]